MRVKAKVNIDSGKITGRFKSDKFGLFAASEWKKLINPFTPRDNGILINTAVLSPFKITYIQPYSHYVYTGVKYVDPVYKVGGFYSPDYGWFSRPGIKKIPSDEPLKYQKKSPFATDHWDKKAEAAGQKDKLYQSINAALESGRI